MQKNKLGELIARGVIKRPPSQKAIRAHLDFLSLGNQDADADTIEPDEKLLGESDESQNTV